MVRNRKLLDINGIGLIRIRILVFRGRCGLSFLSLGSERAKGNGWVAPYALF
jgi:hypothetical protein